MKAPPPDPIIAEARAFMREREPDRAHVLHVARLADRLFVLLHPLHALGPQDRTLLQAAALLHDIGWSVAPDGRAHHKHSARLIRAKSWTSLDADGVEIVAQTARYHRRKLPRTRHKPHARLAPAARRRVCALAALLRMADALDRAHRGRVRTLEIRFRPERLDLTASVREPASDEEYAFLLKRDLFVQHFKIPIQLHTRS